MGRFAPRRGKLAINEHIPLPDNLPAVVSKKVSAAFDGARMTPDGGVMLLAQAERRLGIADHLDRLRFDPAVKLACGWLPDTGRDLCSQPTVSR